MADRASLERQLAAARKARAHIQNLLDETDGWDDLDQDDVDDFVGGRIRGAARMLTASDWDESKVNRDKDGQFSPSEGAAGDKPAEKKGIGKRIADAVKQALGLGPKPEPPAPDTFAGKLHQAMSKPIERTVGTGLPVYKIDGKEYVLKQGRRFSESEFLGAKHAAEAGVKVAPVVQEKTPAGNTANLSVVVPGTRIADIGSADLSKQQESERAKAAALEKLPHAELERHALYDYVIGYTDGNDGNYLIDGDKLVGIDKDPSFSEGKGDETKFTRPKYLRLLGENEFTFSKAEVDKMAVAGARIASALERDGKANDARGVRNRVEVLQKLTELYGDKPNLGQLKTLGDGFQFLKRRDLNGAFTEIGAIMRLALLQSRGDPDDPTRETYGTVENMPDGTFRLTGDISHMEWFLDNHKDDFRSKYGYVAQPAELLHFIAHESSFAKIGKIRVESSGWAPARPRLLTAE